MAEPRSFSKGTLVKEYRYLGVALAEAQLRRVDAMAQDLGTSRSAMIRQLLDVALPFVEAGHGVNLTRLIAIIESTQAATDRLLTLADPDFAERLPVLTIERLNAYHDA
nr:ribbon-helix-helix protein, CopG family [Novosphingobium olei]